VVHRIAVAKLGSQPGPEAEQLTQPERHAALHERGEVAIAAREPHR
jgi:hypothetical protein